jgi:hypothetical protein
MKNYPPEFKADAVALYESRPETSLPPSVITTPYTGRRRNPIDPRQAAAGAPLRREEEITQAVDHPVPLSG